MTDSLIHTEIYGHWTFEKYDIQAKPTDFGAFESLVALWHQKKEGSLLPSRQDFDFYDFHGWYGHIAIHEKLNYRDRDDVRINLFGTSFVEAWEEDLTNIYASEQPGETKASNEYDRAFFLDLLHHPYIGIARGPADWLKKQYKMIHCIYLPMSGTDGHSNFLLNGLLVEAIDLQNRLEASP